ncbi:MAG: ABC transporter permease subunit [Calditrichia bacterium]
MNRNLFLRELKESLQGSLILSLAVGLYISFSISIYSVMIENITKVTDLYSAIPKSLRIAFNFDLNQWTHILGFYVTYFVYFVPIIAGCYSIISGGKILSKEEQHKTSEFLLSRPISREQIITSKLFSLLLHIIGINLFIFVTALVSCGIVSKWNINLTSFTILHTYGLLMCIFFGVLGFFITVLMKRARAITGLGLGIVLGSYFFDMMIRLADRLQFLLYLTPFKYLNLDVVSPGYRFDFWRLGFFLGTTALMIGFSYFFYRRKDILV